MKRFRAEERRECLKIEVEFKIFFGDSGFAIDVLLSAKFHRLFTRELAASKDFILMTFVLSLIILLR